MLLACAAPAHAVNTGTNVSLGTFPAFATLLYTTTAGSFICGGWLADARHVVTAGHCVKTSAGGTTNDPTRFYVYLNKLPGATPFMPEPSYQAEALFSHPLYDALNYGNDIGVVRLGASVSGITPWPYAKSPVTLSATPECTLYTVIGHGQTCNGGCLSADLQRAYVPKLVGASCVRTPADYDYTEWPSSVVGPDACFGFAPPCGTLSAANPTSCAGDSGGPLFSADGTVVALVSRGSAKACTTTIKPGIYTPIGNTDNAAWLAAVIAATYAPPSSPPPPKPPSAAGASLRPSSTVVPSSAVSMRIGWSTTLLIAWLSCV